MQNIVYFKKFYLFVFGCVGSSLLCSLVAERRLLSSSARAYFLVVHGLLVAVASFVGEPRA